VTYRLAWLAPYGTTVEFSDGPSSPIAPPRHQRNQNQVKDQRSALSTMVRTMRATVNVSTSKPAMQRGDSPCGLRNTALFILLLQHPPTARASHKRSVRSSLEGWPTCRVIYAGCFTVAVHTVLSTARLNTPTIALANLTIHANDLSPTVLPIGWNSDSIADLDPCS
jgi:hypothetical protein